MASLEFSTASKPSRHKKIKIKQIKKNFAAGGRGRDEGGELWAERAEARHHGQGEHICSNLFVSINHFISDIQHLKKLTSIYWSGLKRKASHLVWVVTCLHLHHKIGSLKIFICLLFWNVCYQVLGEGNKKELLTSADLDCLLSSDCLSIDRTLLIRLMLSWLTRTVITSVHTQFPR